MAPTPNFSSANEGFRLGLGMCSSSVRSLSADDRAETESKSFSLRARDADVETDPLAEAGALEDVGDRREAREV